MADPAKYGTLRLEVYQLADDLSIRIDAISNRFPFFEKLEEGRQVRRSSKSTSALIVEGYGLRKYKDKFLYYLHQALGSSDETRHHLEVLFKTGSLKNIADYSKLAATAEKLSAKLGAFIKGVEKNHTMPYYLRHPKATGKASRRKKRPVRGSSIENRKSRIGS